jgi:hypothetical protein
MKLLFLVITQLYTIAFFAQKATPQDYIKKYATKAQQEMKRSGVPAAITLAQGILESESGNSDLATKSNNHFGIKCKSNWTGEKVYHNDDERGECFRKYSTVEDSYKDHSDFLKNNERYAFLFDLEVTDYYGWAKGLKKAGYATNPVYAQRLIDIIEKYEIQKYNDIANLDSEKEPVNDSAQKKEVVIITPAPIETVSYPTATVTDAEITVAELDEKNKNKVIKVKGTKAVKVAAGTSLLATAEKHNLTLDKLLEYNNLPINTNDILATEMVLFIKNPKKKFSLFNNK